MFTDTQTHKHTQKAVCLGFEPGYSTTTRCQYRWLSWSQIYWKYIYLFIYLFI